MIKHNMTYSNRSTIVPLCKTYRRTYPWVEGRVIPNWAKDAIKQSPGDPVMMVLVELDKDKQREGWPRFCMAVLDVLMGIIICHQTAENISSHVIRYMPIDGDD